MRRAARDAAQPLIEIVRGTLADLRRGEAQRCRVSLDSRLDQDLGLDSLARVELFTRVERDLRVRLPDALLERAETVRDIYAALDTSAPAARLLPQPVPPAEHAPASAAPLRELATLTDVLDWHVTRQPDFAQMRILGQGGHEQERLTYLELLTRARSIAGGLQQRGIQRGESVALMLPTGAEYFCAFFGILLAGATPVPLYPPARPSQIEEHVRRHIGILTNAAAAALLTDAPMRRVAALLRLHVPELRRIETVAELEAMQAIPVPVALGAQSIALLQYTSGSTGQPKGVIVSHANVLANLSALGRALGIGRSDVFVSWLPLYHDMGLIGAWLGTLCLGVPLVVMSPLAFLARPLHWLEALHRHGGTLSAAPNFAYELCLKRVTDEELEGLDLRRWRIAMNGAEAVSPHTIERFAGRFARCGFERTAMTPVYGLAECTLGLAVPPPGRGALVDAIDRVALMERREAIPARRDAVQPLRFTSCGRPLDDHAVRIVDDAGTALGERREGRLEIRGPSIARGYFRNEAASAKLLHQGWLDSGDRAYLADGELYVTGRVKDIVIRAGRNIHPEELEAAVGALEGVRKGCVAVFGNADEASGTERLIVMAEISEATSGASSAARALLEQRIVDCSVALIGEPPDEIALVAPHTVLKTSSGKVRRAANRALHESGRHRDSRARSAGVQLLRLAMQATPRALERVLKGTVALAYAVYFWGLFGLLGTIIYLLMLPMRPGGGWPLAHRVARLFIRAVGVRFTIHGREHLHATDRRIVVVNHASYLDGLFVLAALPWPCRFVAKRELEHLPVVASLLRRLGVEFVERFDMRESISGARRLAAVASDGASCIYFPEGTFTRFGGLLPFHLGAFAAAQEARLPVLPIALCGTRRLLRDEQWLPRRCPVTMHIGAPIEPGAEAGAFAATVRLRDAARAAIELHLDAAGP